MEAAVRSTEERLARMLEAGSEDPRLDAALRRSAHVNGLKVRAQLASEAARLDHHRAEVTEPARARLVEASVHKRSVESLLERKLEFHEAERLALEGRGLDEAGQGRWVRQRDPR
jgi:hypothetical protein